MSEDRKEERRQSRREQEISAGRGGRRERADQAEGKWENEREQRSEEGKRRKRKGKAESRRTNTARGWNEEYPTRWAETTQQRKEGEEKDRMQMH